MADAVRRGDFLRHPFARQLRDRVGGGDLHRVVDAGRADVQGAAEDEREAEHVVDLVRIIRAAGRDDRIGARGHREFGADLRLGVGHREDDRRGGHVLDHLRRERSCRGEPQEHVGADQRLGQRARLGDRGVRGLPLVDALAALVDHALAVTEDDVVAAHAHRLHEFGAGDRRGTGAVDDDLDLGQLAACEQARVDQAGGGDDRGAVLVVMEDRDVHPLAQRLLDDEAFGRLDVLEVDAAEGRLHQLDRVDEAVHVLGLQLDIDRVDVGEALEENRLAFHHRLAGERAEIAHAEDRGAVRDHRDEVPLGGIVVDGGGIVVDRLHRHRDAGRIGERQVALRGHRLGGDDLDLPRTAFRMEEQGFAFGELQRFVGHGRASRGR